MHTRGRARRFLGGCLLLAVASCLWISVLALYLHGELPPPTEPTGPVLKARGNLVLDITDASDGFLMARCLSDDGVRRKLRIEKDDKIYTYDINTSGEYEVYPLQMGSGSYTCTLYRNIRGYLYAEDGAIRLDVALSGEHAPFLRPSQYVNYGADSPAVLKAAELCRGLETDAEKLEAIRSFLVESFSYDYARARTIKGGYLGDIDGVFESKTGLCQDLAAIAACMLRAQGIPAQMALGRVDGRYHAWNYVLIDGEYRFLDVTGEISGIGRDAVYTPERYY